MDGSAGTFGGARPAGVVTAGTANVVSAGTAGVVAAAVAPAGRARSGAATVVLVRGLALPVVIGVRPEERLQHRTLELEIEIGLATRAACASDAIVHTIDYGEVVARLRAEVAGKSYHLLERLADELAAMILEEFEAAWVRLVALKFGMFDDVVSTGVEVFRRRDQRREGRNGKRRG